MNRLPRDLDIHTHSGALRPDAVLCVDPATADSLPEGDGLLSVGIHPWNADRADAKIRRRLVQWLEDKRVVAVGECGLDRLRGPSLEVQTEVFRFQAELAASRDLPLVIHCVRCADRLLKLRKELCSRPDDCGQWIYHGFRGNASLARQLLDAGIDLSFGEKYNPEAFGVVPSERRYRETD